MSELNTMLSEIDPMVSLKLSDYEKIMKYIKILEDAPSNENAYKKSLESFVNGLNSSINNMGIGFDYSTTQSIYQKIHSVLDANSLRLERTGNLHNSLLKVVPK